MWWLINQDAKLPLSILRAAVFQILLKQTASSFTMLKKKMTAKSLGAHKHLTIAFAGYLSAGWMHVTSETSQEDIQVSYYSFTLISKQ